MATPAPPQTRQCVACGKSMMWDANVCPYCGKDYRQPAPGMMPMAPPKKHTALPVVGGILMLLVGIAGLVEGLMVILFALGVVATFGMMPIDLFGVGGIGGLVTTIILIVGLIPVLLGVFAILGGASAIGRKHHGMAVFGGVCAMLILGPVLITNILGLVSLILVAVSHDEFS